MPTDLPEGFKGTGKRSTPNPPVPNRVHLPIPEKMPDHWVDVDPAEEHPGEDTSGPVWLQVLFLLIFLVGMWFVGGWTLAAIIALAHLAF